MGVNFPGETPEYREARRRLLQREVALRREMEAVAADVRSLPPGGEIPEDYVFDHIRADGVPTKVRLSKLFRPGTNALIVYHFMPLSSPENGKPGHDLLLFLRVDDFDETLSRARTLRLRLEEEPHINLGTKTLEFSLLDPDGYYVSMSALATAQHL